MAQPLMSDWGGLNPLLIASFYEVKRVEDSQNKTYKWVQVEGGPVVKAPITDANIEHVSNWTSPFENIGADQKFSSLSAILQSGALTSLLSQFKSFLDKQGMGDSGVTDAARGIQSLEGRTSVTKLSSRQIYSGSPPMKLSLTAHFRAWSNAKSEVEDPVNQLMAWFLPKKLAEDGPVLALANDKSPSVYPSLIPSYVAMQYAGALFKPMVIEAMPIRLTAPRGKDGRMLQQSIQLTMASLTSLDAEDWRTAFTQK